MEKNKGGRPTKYLKEYVATAYAYLDVCQDDVVQVLESVNPKTGRERYTTKFKVNLPTIEGFARYLGVNTTTLYEWAKTREQFSNALRDIKTEQATRLQNMGLSGDYNSTIAKLILSSNHGMSEKTITDLTTKGESLNFDDNQAKRIAAEILKGGTDATDNPASEGTPA